MERDIKISECYLHLGEIGLENKNYTGAIGDLLECQVLQKQHFGKFDWRYNNSKEHFESARNAINGILCSQWIKFAESEKESEKLMSEIAITQLKDIRSQLNTKLEDIECSIKNEKFNKVQEHLDEKVKFFNFFNL